MAIGRAQQMQQSITLSLRELARYLALRPDLSDIAALCADAHRPPRPNQQLARIMAYYGFEAGSDPEHFSIGERMQQRFGGAAEPAAVA